MQRLLLALLIAAPSWAAVNCPAPFKPLTSPGFVTTAGVPVVAACFDPESGSIRYMNADYIQSLSLSPAQSGTLRLANGDTICWRNSTNTGDTCQSIANIAAAAYSTIQNNSTPLAQRTTLNCIGAVTCADTGVLTTISVPTSSSTVLAPVNIASITAAGTAGRFYPWFLDSALAARDNGVSWDYSLPGFGPVTRPKAAASFTTVNFTGATLTDANGGLLLTVPASASNSIRFAFLTSGYPSPSFTKTNCFNPTQLGANFTSMGWAVSDGTKFVTLGIAYDLLTNSLAIEGLNWTNSTTVSGASSGITNSVIGQIGPLVCLTIQDDNINFNLWFSSNQFDLQRVKVITVARTAFLTPSQIGIYGNISNAGTNGSSMLILHSTL